MITDFISITHLQRDLKSVFGSKKPMRVVLSRNSVIGLVLSKDAANILLESGVLDQLREEFWGARDSRKRTMKKPKGS